MPIMLRTLLLEGIKEKMAEDFLRQLIAGTPFQNHLFLAGGYVRDEVLGLDPKDLDIVIDLPNGGIEFTIWAAKQAGNYKEGSNPIIFPTFGTSKWSLKGVVHKEVDLSSIDVECVMTRGEKYTAGSRKPSVNYSDLKTDVERRDATVNSLLKNVSTGEVIDLTGKGMQDIRTGVMRTPLDPNITFSDDPLRMLRFIRQATKYDWNIDSTSMEGIRKNAKKLQTISRERIRDELNKILVTGNPKRGFELLRDTGLLSYIASELQQMVGMGQNKHHSQDVFGHTLSVVQATNPDLVTRLMGLFHDVGKVVTRSETPTGVHFYGHEDAAGDIIEKVMMNLKYPREIIDAVKLGARNHMRLKQGGDDAVKLSDKSLRKFKIELGDQLEKVLDVIHADNVSHAGPSAMPNQIAKVRERLKTLDIQVKKPKLPISGNDLLAMGVPQGPMMGKILSAVTDKWYENPQISREEALNIARSMIV